MIRRYALLYFLVFTIPIFLGIAARQSIQYTELDRNVRRLEASQEDLVESNKRLIASIAVLSSSSRIGHVAVHDLGFAKMRPENVLQIRIEGGRRY